jgi:asparagine synthase (glutamine-hydrolysing)
MEDIPDIAKRVVAGKLTYLSQPKLRSLFAAIARVKSGNVPGDFVEFGVALGGSAICIASELDGARRFWGFDVFGTIPPPGEKDGAEPQKRYDLIASGRSKGIAGETYYGYIADLLDTVKANFAGFGITVDDSRVRLIQGRYEDSLMDQAPFPIAFAHIDCDWYESVRTCLAFLRANLSPGGIVVLDDYNDWKGCKVAVDEFCAQHNDFKMTGKTPHGILVRRR